jgi:hypothetical protein
VAWLDDARLKLSRADVHLCALESEVRKKLREKKRTVTIESKFEVTESGSKTFFAPIRFVDPPDFPDEWALLIGDFASNARSALDHLAWQLAERNTWAARKAQRLGDDWPPGNTEFPIYAHFPKPSTKKRLKEKLSIFRPADRRLVASVQPHKRGNLAHAEPLWLLNEIRNADTHRTLHTVLADVPASLRQQLFELLTDEEGQPIGYRLPHELRRFHTSHSRVPLAVGDVLYATTKVDAEFAPFITFDQRGADFHGQEVLPLLTRCRDEVERILGMFP